MLVIVVGHVTANYRHQIVRDSLIVTRIVRLTHEIVFNLADFTYDHNRESRFLLTFTARRRLR